MHAGTTSDLFLRENFEWLGKATNWAKFSATAVLGVIHKGNFEESSTLLDYAMDSVLDTNFSLSYRDEVLRFLLLLFPPSKAQAAYINAVTRLLVTLGDPSLAIPLLTSLVPTENLLA